MEAEMNSEMAYYNTLKPCFVFVYNMHETTL